jgi:phosphoglycerol transferase MdoB-like AlkP superfamily enzyme
MIRTESANPPTAPDVQKRGLLAGHVRFFLVVLGGLTLSRLLLMVWLSRRVDSLADAWSVVLGGWRMDALVLCYGLAPALLLALLLGGRGAVGRWVSSVLRAYFTVIATAFTFFEFITPPFVLEYDSRPNRLFLEYLVHPKEVTSMLLGGYKLEIVLVSVVTASAALVAWRLFRDVVRPTLRTGFFARVGLFALYAPLIFLGARSSLQHRAANPSSVAFSQDHLLNDLSISSLYSVAYAARRMGDEADAASVYGSIPEAEIVKTVRESMVTVRPEDFVSEEFPTQHEQRATATPVEPLNLVIILEESLGAQFVGELGGANLAPRLGELAREGWWFEQLYATGTRSVRGIEAVVAGFLPTPARSTVKLGLSQHDFFTIADFVGDRGYRTQFIYGGESHFDNMKRFFTGNGFQEVIDQDDFAEPRFEGSWGVCDEDILDRLHEELTQVDEEPLFTLAFTVSNHSPWEFPEEGLKGPAHTREGAVRYADHALGRFFDRAREADYWDRTLFLVVADHDSRVYGASLVPVEHFQVPAVILGPGVEPRRDERVVSQVDLAPTLLSLLGLSGVHPMVGHDLTALPDDHPGRAILQYGANQAYLEGSDVVVLQPESAPSSFTWTGSELVPREEDPTMARRALAHALLPSLLYSRRLYRPYDASSMR